MNIEAIIFKLKFYYDNGNTHVKKNLNNPENKFNDRLDSYSFVERESKTS